jgi:hypothetical protein
MPIADLMAEQRPLHPRNLRLWDGTDWENFCVRIFDEIYGERFQDVPSHRVGDLGVDGFLRNDGCIFQCYAVVEPHTTKSRYEAQRDKLSDELRKLKRSLPELTELLGHRPRRYVLVVPEFDGPRLLKHAQTKTRELREDRSMLIDPSFEVTVLSEARLLGRLRAGGLHTLKATDSLKELEPFYGREMELARLTEKARAGSLLELVGAPGAGKTQLLAHWLHGEHFERFEEASTAGVVGAYAGFAERAGPYAVVRALRGCLDGGGPDEPAARYTYSEETADEIFASLLADISDRFALHMPLLVIDGTETVTDDGEKARVERLLQLNVLRSGTTIALGHRRLGENVRSRLKRPSPIELGPLGDPELRAMLLEIAAALAPEEESDAWARAVEQELIDPSMDELRLPETLQRAEDLALSQKRRGDHSGEPRHFVTAVLDSLGNFVVAALQPFGAETLGSEREPGSLAALSAISLLNLPLDRESFLATGLESALVDDLVASKWVLSVDGKLELGPTFLVGLRALLRKPPYEAVGSALSRALDALIRETQAAHSLHACELVERALAFVERDLGDVPTLLDPLRCAVLLLAPSDPVPAVGELEARRAATDTNVLAKVVVEARFGTSDHSFSRAVEQYTTTAPTADELSEAVLTQALATASERFGDSRSVLEARTTLHTDMGSLERASGTRLLLRAQWHADECSEALKFREIQRSREALQQLRTLLDRVDENRVEETHEWTQLQSRARSLEARLEPDPNARLTLMTDAYELAVLAFAADRSWNPRFLMRAARLLVEEAADDEERIAVAMRTEDLIRAEPPSGRHVPLGVEAHMATLMRRASRSCVRADSQLRLLTHEDQNLQARAAHISYAASAGNTRPLLEQARIHAEIARNPGALQAVRTSHLKKALRLSRRAVELGGGALAWRLYLRHLDIVEPAIPGELSERLKMEVKAARRWLKKSGSGAPAARLATWCLERQWRAEGSLEAVLRRADVNYRRLSSEKRHVELKRLHERRIAAIRRIENSFGAIPDSYLLRAKNREQFDASVAIVEGNGLIDTEPVEKILAEAAERWPENNQIALAHATLMRRTWRYDDAIAELELFISGVEAGDARREAIAKLVDTLLTASVYGVQLADPDMTTRRMVEMAANLVQQLKDYGPVAEQYVFLEKRVAIEVDNGVAFEQVDSVYSMLFEDGDYLSSVLRHLDELILLQEEGRPSFDSVMALKFTYPSGMLSLGHLYLRRAEIDPARHADDFERAYHCFARAERLELDWQGRAKPTTLYLIARSIYGASRELAVPNPFSVRNEGDYVTALGVAAASVDRAQSYAIGEFRSECRRVHSALADLALTLSSDNEITVELLDDMNPVAVSASQWLHRTAVVTARLAAQTREPTES